MAILSTTHVGAAVPKVRVSLHFIPSLFLGHLVVSSGSRLWTCKDMDNGCCCWRCAFSLLAVAFAQRLLDFPGWAIACIWLYIPSRSLANLLRATRTHWDHLPRDSPQYFALFEYCLDNVCFYRSDHLYSLTSKTVSRFYVTC